MGAGVRFTRMEIITWNLPRSFRGESHGDAWEYCLNRLDADYYLLQEARPPAWVRDDHELVWAGIGGTRPWGSAVVSSRHPLSEIEIETDFRGAMMVAESSYGAERTITLISVYGLMEKLAGVGYSIPNLHRMLSDLTGLLEARTHGDRDVVLGGDLNASEQLDEIYGHDTHGVLFDRIEAFGLTDCLGAFHDDYVRTLRHNRSDRDWQNDYLFVSDGLADRLRGCDVLEDDAIRKYSDHNPVRVTLDLE